MSILNSTNQFDALGDEFFPSLPHPDHPAPPPLDEHDAAHAVLPQDAVHPQEAFDTDNSTPDPDATPRPADVALEEHPRILHQTASPTTSEVEQAGFIPVPGISSRKHKHPGTPSDKRVEEDRRSAIAALRPNVEISAIAYKEAAPPSLATHKPAGAAQTMRAQAAATAKKIEEHFMQRDGAPRIPAPAKRISVPVTITGGLSKEADRAVHAEPEDNGGATAQRNESTKRTALAQKMPPTHLGHFAHVHNSSFTISRLQANESAAAAKKSTMQNARRGIQGPSPQRAESSMTAALHASAHDNGNADLFRTSIKQEHHSPSLQRPHLLQSFTDSDDDDELSPSEEKVRRENIKARAEMARRREKGKARAIIQELPLDLDRDGIAEIPPPQMSPPAREEAMVIDSSSASDSDSNSESDDGDDGSDGVAIEIPTPDEEELEATRALHPILSQSTIRVTVTGSPHVADGLPRNYYWRHGCQKQRRTALKREGFKKLVRTIGVIGRPDIGPDDPVMHPLLIKTLHKMLGSGTRVLVTRMNAAIDAKPGEEVEPGTFILSGLNSGEADLLEQIFWMLAGIMQLEFHNIEEDASDFVYVASGAKVSDERFKRLLFREWETDEGMKAVIERVAANKNTTTQEALALIVGSTRVTRQEVSLPTTPGVKTRQFVVNGGAFMTPETHRRFREAAAAITVDTYVRGRAVAWNGWNCIVCHAVSHPTGKCRSRVLEGWAEAADIIIRRLKEQRRNGANKAGPSNATTRGSAARRGGRGGGRGGRGSDRGGFASGSRGAARGRTPTPWL